MSKSEQKEVVGVPCHRDVQMEIHPSPYLIAGVLWSVDFGA
jgi:hypothetical protein